MSQQYRVLGQAFPGAGILTDVYICTKPVKSAIISAIVLCNQGAADIFSVAVAINGAADDNHQYIFRDTPIGANATEVLAAGVTLAQGDVLRVESAAGQFSCNVFGVENS